MLECLASHGIRYEEHGDPDRKAQFLKQSHVIVLHPQKSYNVLIGPVELELRPVSRSKAKQKAFERNFEAYRNNLHHAVPQILSFDIAKLEPMPAVQGLKGMEAFLHAMADFELSKRDRGNHQVVGPLLGKEVSGAVDKAYNTETGDVLAFKHLHLLSADQIEKRKFVDCDPEYTFLVMEALELGTLEK
ncbi:MAG: hypothetical protein Q9164_006550 [Protoblastenia rupestris]